MTPHDRWLEPDEDEYCDQCDGFEVIYRHDGTERPCPCCQGDNDLGEPDNYPDDDPWFGDDMMGSSS